MLDNKTAALIRSTHHTLMPDLATFQRSSAPQDSFGQQIENGGGTTFVVSCLYVEKEQRPASEQEGDQKAYRTVLRVPHDASVLPTDQLVSLTLGSGAVFTPGPFRIKSITHDRPTGPVLMALVELEAIS
jgi:hypothetical protein